MIDHYGKALELMGKMETQLPIPVRATRMFIHSMRENGIQIKSKQDLQIESVLYMGDEGGIGCAIRVPGHEETPIVTSLTYIHIRASHPLAEEIRAYQAERTRRLARVNPHRKPTQFTVKARRKNKGY